MKNNISKEAILKERIAQALISAVKSKDKIRALVLRSLGAAIKNSEIVKRSKIAKSAPGSDLEKSAVLSDEEIIGVISSQVKQRRDSIHEFEKGGRIDLVEKEKAEMEILLEYLPKQMSEDEIRKIVGDAIGKTGAKSVREMGKVMTYLMPHVKGKADGVLVSKIVKELLSA